MKNKALLALIAIALLIISLLIYFIQSKSVGYSTDTQTLAKGKDLFEKYCRSCHGLTEDGIGPRLGGVTFTRSRESLVKFISNPSQLVDAGDKRANGLFKLYKQRMPSFTMIGEEGIQSVLAYIDHETRTEKIKPLEVTDSVAIPVVQRYAPAIKPSGLVIALEDFIKLPRPDSTPPDKGLATLRSGPLHDGSIFVSDQMGVIYRINNQKADTFFNVRAQLPDFIFTPGIGTGLGSFAFHPDYLHNGLIYTTHAERYLGKPADFQFADTFRAGLQWVLSEWKINDVKANKFNGTRRELLRINEPTTAHGVQDLSFAPVADKSNPDYGKLFMGIGDGGSNNIKRPDLVHSKKSLLGTVIRIDPLGKNSPNGHYGIPPDNPFANDTDPMVRKEIWAYGFRNPHRLAWDMKNKGRMLVADIGEANVEELNVIEKGADYGWPAREGNYRIDTKESLKKLYPLSSEERTVFHPPFAEYDHTDGNAISGGFVYEGEIALLKDKYLFGDIVNGRLLYVNVDKPLSDSSIYEISIVAHGQPTSMAELSHIKRVHLRVGYDDFTHELYMMSKDDGMIRKLVKAYIKK